MFRFANPYYFFLLLPVGAAAWWVYRRRVRRGILFATAGLARDLGRTWRTRTADILPALFVAGLVLSVFALARPQTVFSTVRRSADVIAIEMVVDVSGSMNALDLSTRTPAGVQYRTRLDAVKTTFDDFIAKRPDDLIGLVTFGGYATTRVPLTADHDALRHVLSGVEIPKQVYEDGKVVNQEELLTAIGDALATAAARLKDAEPTSRIIVLLSDGESNTGIFTPETAIEAAARMGVKVYTIGVGMSGRAPFWGKDMFGRRALQYANVRLDEKLLKSIADETGALYFNVRSAQGLENALEHIDELEKTRVKRNEYHQYDEWFPWLLFPAVLLIVAATGLNMLVSRRIV